MAPLRTPAPFLCLGLALFVGCSNDDGGTDVPTVPSQDSSSGPSDDDDDTPDDSSDPGEIPEDGGDTWGAETTTDEPPDTGGDETDGESGGDSDTGLGDPDPGDPIGMCVGFDLRGFVDTVGVRNESNVGGSCSAAPSACGGDLVGAWAIENNCGNENTPNLWGALCPPTSRVVRRAETFGTVRFGDDNEYSQQTSTIYEEEIAIDAQGCFAGTCQGFEVALKNAGFLASCDGEDFDCACDLTYINDVSVSGTYEISGSDVYITVGDNLTKVPYCADGDRLDMWTPQFQPTFTTTPCYYDTYCGEVLGNEHENYWCRPTPQTPTIPGPYIDLDPWTPPG